MRTIDPRFLRKLQRRNHNRAVHVVNQIRSTPMLTFVELVVNIKSHDNNSPFAQGGNLGPITTAKNVAFQAWGSDVEAAIADAHKQLLAFLQSDAILIGSTERPKITPALDDFPRKGKFVPGRGNVPAAEDDGSEPEGDGPEPSEKPLGRLDKKRH